jgi:predicted transcriptional regulator
MATTKALVLRTLGHALLPLSTPDLVRLTGRPRGAVWTELVRLRRLGVVRCRHRRARGDQSLDSVGRPRRWELVRRAPPT